jgi:hypothetical protein
VIDEILGVSIAVLDIALVDSIYGLFDVINCGLEGLEFASGWQLRQACLKVFLKIFFSEFHRRED